MTATLPSLANAGWLRAASVQRIFAVLEAAGEEVRVVGGAVRNALMSVPVTDIDLATTATPERVTALAEAAGIKAVPTGVEHGTVTLVASGQGFQMTTLREDVETDGRRAVVRFGRDWLADALRRDFTVNGLSVDSAGKVYDPVGGYPDIIARRIRFIGDPDQRIAEDRLRILRLFRFQAEYGSGDIDPDGLSAAIRARDGLRDLSAERIGQEMRRIVTAPRATEIAMTMQDAGILPVVLASVGYVAAFARLIAFAPGHGAAVRLAALACRIDEDALRVAERLRLTNAERDLMRAAIAASAAFQPLPNQRGARAVLYRLQVDAYRAGASLAFAWSGAAIEDPAWHEVVTLPDWWPQPKFPLGGRDIIGAGIRGAAVGELLRAVESWWVDEDFAPDEAALRARLQQMMAAAQ